MSHPGGTPEWFIEKQERRRRRGKVNPPCVRPVLGRIGERLRWVTLPITTPYNVTSPIGKPWSLGRHTGEDHAAPVGSHALAVSWGEVVCVAVWTAPGAAVRAAGPVPHWGSSYGSHVIIRTGDGAHDYALCHLSEIHVKPGDRVRPGQTLGRTGATGGSGTFGPHLHLEARPAGGRFGTDVNPLRVKRMST